MSDFTKILIIVSVIAYIISKRNEFEKLRQEIQHAESDISVCKSKRKECVTDAMKIAKISYRQEVEGLERLTARDQLDQLAFLGEKYPELQTMGGYRDIMNEAIRLDREIAAYRELLNGNINAYNQSIASFPGLIIAKIFKYTREEFIDEENYGKNRKLEQSEVDFSQF